MSFSATAILTMETNLLGVWMKHGLNPGHRAELSALVVNGQQPSSEVRNRIQHVANYKAALAEAQAIHRAMVPQVRHYESLPACLSDYKLPGCCLPKAAVRRRVSAAFFGLFLPFEEFYQ